MSKKAVNWFRGVKPAVWKPLLVAALGLAAFWPTLRGGFMIDDPFLLNAVQAEPGFTLKGLRSDFTHNVHHQAGSLYYRPVLGALTRAEFSLWDARPFGYHAVSLLFHLGSAVLLFYLLSLLEIGTTVPLAAACLFAVNPVIVDDLLAATGGESMANFLMLASLLLFLRGKWLTAWLLSFPVFFAKESNLVLPALLALFLAYKGRLKEELPKVLSLLPGCLLFLWLRHLYVAPAPGLDPATVLRFMIKVFPRAVLHYLRVLLFPFGLETWPPMFQPSSLWPLAAAALAALSALLLWPLKRRLAVFCAGWFLILMAPRVPAIIVNMTMMDKWVFLAGPAVFVAMLVRLFELRDSASPWLRALPYACLGAALTFWTFTARTNISRRGSDEKNYRWTIRAGPRLFASYRLGLILLSGGRPAEAVEVLEPLAALAPGDPDCQNALSMALWHSGRQKEAWLRMRELAARYPDNVSIRENYSHMRGLIGGGN